MTTRINKKDYNLDELVAQAVNMASDGYICPADQRMARTPEAAYMMTIARYIGKITGFTPDWQRLNRDDLAGSLAEIVAVYNKRAGVRGLKRTYGKESAERIIENKTGRKVTLR